METQGAVVLHLTRRYQSLRLTTPPIVAHHERTLGLRAGRRTTCQGFPVSRSSEVLVVDREQQAERQPRSLERDAECCASFLSLTGATCGSQRILILCSLDDPPGNQAAVFVFLVAAQDRVWPLPYGFLLCLSRAGGDGTLGPRAFGIISTRT